MNSYRSKVYKITNTVDSKIYIGSTCNSLLRRFRDHIHMAKIKPERKLYAHMLQVGIENCKIELVEHCYCKTKADLVLRERFYVEMTKAELNSIMPIEDHQDVLKHKRVKNTCQCGGKYTNSHRAQHMKSDKHVEGMHKWIDVAYKAL
jgi:group I intron endonuclease